MRPLHQRTLLYRDGLILVTYDLDHPIRPDAWQLEPGLTFLNHGSFGACPTSVSQRQSDLRRELESSPVQFFVSRMPELIDAARDQLATFLGTTPDNLVFVRNATMGVNVVLRSLKWNAGDRILVTNHGYNACINVARFLHQTGQIELDVADIPFPIDDPATVVERLVQSITPQTRLLLVDHVTSPTGLVFPIATIIQECSQRGVMVLVDGAHAPGMTKFELDQCGADFYTGNCHKWLCAPKGTAFLYVKPAYQSAVQPAVISHGFNTPRPSKSNFHAHFDWPGTDDPTGWCSLPAALDFLDRLAPGGHLELSQRNHALVTAGRRLICNALGIEPPCPDSMLGSLASMCLPKELDWDAPDASTHPTDHDRLAATLLQEHRIEVPVFPFADSNAKLLRISAQAYNAIHQYEQLADALVQLRERRSKNG